MTTAHLRAATAALALGGAAIAAYLSYTRMASAPILCPTSGCEAVQRSTYSQLAGVPVAYLGFFGYLVIALAALSGRRRARRLGTALVAAAVGFSTYLLVVQLAVIDAVCAWCVASDGVVLVLAAVTAVRELGAVKSAKSPESFRVRLNDFTVE